MGETPRIGTPARRATARRRLHQRRTARGGRGGGTRASRGCPRGAPRPSASAPRRPRESQTTNQAGSIPTFLKRVPGPAALTSRACPSQCPWARAYPPFSRRRGSAGRAVAQSRARTAGRVPGASKARVPAAHPPGTTQPTLPSASAIPLRRRAPTFCERRRPWREPSRSEAATP